MNITKIIEFKSTPEEYVKEESGIKSNTVRIMDIYDFADTLEQKDEIKYIKVTNTKTGETFMRGLTDISTYESGVVQMFIFSWKR